MRNQAIIIIIILCFWDGTVPFKASVTFKTHYNYILRMKSGSLGGGSPTVIGRVPWTIVIRGIRRPIIIIDGGRPGTVTIPIVPPVISISPRGCIHSFTYDDISPVSFGNNIGYIIIVKCHFNVCVGA